jgi:outer membrane protein TolC
VEVEINRETNMNVLGEFLEMELEETITFEIPEYLSVPASGGILRPEVGLLESQISQLGLSDDVLRSSRRPKIFAFTQIGYGRPGLNMLSDEFDPYYLVGARISWNPFDWKKNRREREILQLQQGQVSNQIDAFTRNVNIELESARSEITKYRRLMDLDKEIIEMRSRIVAASASKLDNGVINSAQFVTDLNGEKQARIDMEIHRMMMLKSQATYHVKKGN